MENLKNLDKFLNIKNFNIYKDETIKDMVDLYFKNSKKKYDLFSFYVLGTDQIIEKIKDDGFLYYYAFVKNFTKFKKTIFLKNGDLNFRNPIIKYISKNFTYLYVGNLFRNEKYVDVFLSISKIDTEYFINGFSIDNGNRTYFFDKSYIKKIGKIDEKFSASWYDKEMKNNLLGIK